MDIIKPNQKQVEIQIKTVRPGVTRIKFKNFEDMGNYYESRMEEFRVRGVQVETIGVCMYVYEKGSR